MKTTILTAILFFATGHYCEAQAPVTMLDSSFGNKGLVIYTDTNGAVNTQNFFDVNKLAMQGNKIIVAANFETAGETYLPDTSNIFRLNENGTLDSTFGVNGIFTFEYFRHTAATIHALHCQSDGKILCLFSSDFFGKPWLKWYYGLLRLNANGTIDSTFADSGYRKIFEGLQDMVILPNDEIVVAAIKNFNGKRGYALLKYTAEGILIARDSVTIDSPAFLPDFPKMRLRVTDNNKIMLAADARYNNRFSLVTSLYQFDFSLKRNNAYGGNGAFHYIVDIRNLKRPFSFFDATTQSNGKMVIGTLTEFERVKLIGVDSNGILNNDFGINGVSAITYPGYLQQLQTQKDDRIVASMIYEDKMSVGRFTANGNVDSSFGQKGITYKSIFVRGQSAYSRPGDMILQNDDKIVYGSWGQSDDQEGILIIARYLPEKLSSNAITKSSITSSLKIAKSTIFISPNPVKDVLNITSKNLSYQHISVFDASGIQVFKDGFAGKQHSINVSRLNAGVYYMQTMTDNKVETIKFIKQ